MSNWDGNFRIDTAEKYYGLYSFKVYSANDARINYGQNLSIVPGKTYTLSALVKINGTLPGNGGAFLGLAYQDANGYMSYEKSEIIKSTEGWERYSVTFAYPEDYSTTASIMIGLEDSQYGICWFDDVQLEEGAVANRYNMVDNGSMETVDNGVPSGWATKNPGSGDSIATGRTGNGYTITGDPDKVKSLYQNRAMDGKKGDTIVADTWAKSNSVLATPEGSDTTSTTPPKDDKKCMLSVTVTYKTIPEGKSSKDVTDKFEFPSMSADWQYLCESVTALGDYEKVRFALEYRYNMNTVTFDDADLYVDTYGATYEYDDSGKIKSAKDSAGQEYKYTYNGPDLTKIEFNKAGIKKDETNYTYDSKHNLTKEVSDAGVISEYTYGENGTKTYGNITKVTIKNTDGTLKTSSAYEYTPDYNYQAKITDARGETVQYQYDTTKGELIWTRDDLGNQTDYTYDQDTGLLLSNVASQVTGSEVVDAYNQYGYNNDVLQTITTFNNTYEFMQDQFGRPAEIKVGAQVLVTNEYNPNGMQKSLLMATATLKSLSIIRLTR